MFSGRTQKFANVSRTYVNVNRKYVLTSNNNFCSPTPHNGIFKNYQKFSNDSWRHEHLIIFDIVGSPSKSYYSWVYRDPASCRPRISGMSVPSHMYARTLDVRISLVCLISLSGSGRSSKVKIALFCDLQWFHYFHYFIILRSRCLTSKCHRGVNYYITTTMRSLLSY